uniref:SAM domain-containing protein n=2 Tax=Rhodosorus marinus TaxID=101924 RepID=A0A7S3E9D2_9RHOD|mmetsp:Transcript_19222/g.76991  ORF Transcript_19222/g.76991 Transcript_19222/m.76991 type:complete len:234 (+) Transcript_19222:292-993(+)|eukprot:CAMPEP_0113957700 /NCGR_PEP_ID=MMETSP0011_2-20120614/2926_1 /TAXON_ID=101924 /ORGANISM="Rhodosorus marinus" /LENGTH=233 /DNA_ID=CAMNT_0000968313 /DNA_START=278 /DNA_END=979 /DNA_ORIENTATION=+ /assembly_acc=CAM_ASM_000156
MEDESTPLLLRSRTGVAEADISSAIEKNQVLEWLDSINMREHEERFLRNGVVTLDDIAALSAEDFRESLGIRRLGHRRAMWDAAALLRDAANPQTRREEGENISTLNHQMNIRTLLAWMRLTIQMKTLAVALIFLEGPPYVRLASSGLVIVAFFILFQAFRQYLTVNDECVKVVEFIPTKINPLVSIRIFSAFIFGLALCGTVQESLNDHRFDTKEALAELVLLLAALVALPA